MLNAFICCWILLVRPLKYENVVVEMEFKLFENVNVCVEHAFRMSVWLTAPATLLISIVFEFNAVIAVLAVFSWSCIPEETPLKYENVEVEILFKLSEKVMYPVDDLLLAEKRPLHVRSPLVDNLFADKRPLDVRSPLVVNLFAEKRPLHVKSPGIETLCDELPNKI